MPEGFRYPKGHASLIWNLWWGGIQCEGIAPLRKLKAFDLVKSVDVTNWSKSKKVVLAIVGHSGFHVDAIAAMTSIQRADAFEKGFVCLCEECFGLMDMAQWDSRRMNEMSYITLYDAIIKLARHSREKK